MVSIIVPIYNIDQYLHKCIDSIKFQSYTDIQIILVDDGSTDESGSICDWYALKDDRIVVVHKKNGGLVSARKAGLERAKGDYILYVDGDDWIENDTIEKLLTVGDGKDIIAFACVEEYDGYSVIKKNLLEEGEYDTPKMLEYLHENMFMKDSFYQFGVLPHLADKMIKRELLEKNQFDVDDSITYGEDAACTYPCLKDANSVYISNLALYHYRQRVGSIVKQSNLIDKNMISRLYNLFLSKKISYMQTRLYLWFVLLVKGYDYIESELVIFPFDKVKKNMKVVIYGAGGFGKTLFNKCQDCEDISVVGWSDLHFDSDDYKEYGLISPATIKDLKFDMLIIAILNEDAALKVKNDFASLGICEEKIVWVKKDCLDKKELPRWLVSN